MFAIIKYDTLIWFSDFEITKENMDFDFLIEGNFDTNKSYIFENGEVKEKRIYTPKELKTLELGATVDENGDIEISEEIELKIELASIEEILKSSKTRYTELKEMWEMRSNAEEIEFQALETWKNTLLARRKQILDSL